MASTAERTGTNGRRLRVLHVVYSLQMGGLERMLLDFARFTDPERFDVGFVSLTGRGAVADLLEEQGHTIRTVDKQPGVRPDAVLRLSRMLRAEKADVIHTHNDAALLYGGLAAKLAGVRRTIHTRHLYEPQSKTLAPVLRFIGGRVDRIVCVSADTERVARANGVPGKRLMTILNGIDVETFSPQTLRTDGPVITVARLSPQKDIGNLIGAVAIARGQGREIVAEVAGDGPLRDKLKAEAEANGVADLVRFVGELRDVRPKLATSSLFCLPSIDEGLSIAMLEAMAMGLPVLATDVGGNRELIVQGETGSLVPSRDSRALAEALVSLTADKARLTAMGRASRERVVNSFNVRRTVQAYEALYSGQG